MKKCVDTALIKRLNRIEGQIKGIKKMLEEDKGCEDVLIQISAAKSALHKTGKVLLEAHIQHCVLDAVRTGNEEAALKGLSTAIEQFSRIG